MDTQPMEDVFHSPAPAPNLWSPQAALAEDTAGAAGAGSASTGAGAGAYTGAGAAPRADHCSLCSYQPDTDTYQSLPRSNPT